MSDGPPTGMYWAQEDNETPILVEVKDGEIYRDGHLVEDFAFILYGPLEGEEDMKEPPPDMVATSHGSDG